MVRKVERVNYEIDMSDKKKRKQMLHINLLRKWHEPSEAYVALEDGANWDGEVPTYTRGVGEVGGLQGEC